MKKVFLLLLTVAFSVSCSNDDDISSGQIEGEWKLIRAEFYGLEGGSSSQGSLDYSDQNITYDFRQNGVLKVTGGENAGYPAGEYQDFFGEDHLGGSSDPKILLVRINNSKWTYNFTNGQMRLGMSYVDGPDLIFEKK